MLFHALWTLCGLASVVCAATAFRTDPHTPTGPRLSQAGGLIAGVVLGALWHPAPASTGLIAAAIAALLLLRPDATRLAAVAAGALAGIAGGLMAARGIPAVVSYASAVSLPLVSVLLATRRSNFAPSLLLEESLFILLPVALLIGAAPQIAQGWASGLNLNAAAHPHGMTGIPSWVLTTLAAAALLGAGSRLWSRN
jgi:hypothetical protein